MLIHAPIWWKIQRFRLSLRRYRWKTKLIALPSNRLIIVENLGGSSVANRNARASIHLTHPRRIIAPSINGAGGIHQRRRGLFRPVYTRVGRRVARLATRMTGPAERGNGFRSCADTRPAGIACSPLLVRLRHAFYARAWPQPDFYHWPLGIWAFLERCYRENRMLSVQVFSDIVFLAIVIDRYEYQVATSIDCLYVI